MLLLDEAHLLIDANFPQPLHFLSQLTKRIRKYQGGIIFTTQNINDFVGDKTIKKYSEAIINNCQYSAIFKMKNKDLFDLSLIFKQNPLSKKELEKILFLPTGECLFFLNNTNKIFLKILSD